MAKKDYRQENLNRLCEALLPDELCELMACVSAGVDTEIYKHSVAAERLVPPYKTLICMLVWSSTPQGHDYWYKVFTRLGGEI